MVTIKNIHIKTVFLMTILASCMQASQQEVKEKTKRCREMLQVLKQKQWTSVTDLSAAVSLLTEQALVDLQDSLIKFNISPTDELNERQVIH